MYKAFVLLCIVLINDHAKAHELCDDAKNTSQEIECYESIYYQVERDLNYEYRQIKLIQLDRSIACRTLQTQLDGLQLVWENFIKRQCAYEADLTLGSAGGYVGYKCLVREFRKRIEFLRGIKTIFEDSR